MVTIRPANYVWREVEVTNPDDGVVSKTMALVPIPRAHNVCRRQFVEGEEYALGPVEERNMRAHNAYFAELHHYYQNLPEKIASRWPSESHFRKWILVEVGFFDEKEFDMADARQAKLLATFIRTEDKYARIVVRGTKVIVRRAASQSRAAMGNERFKESKQAVLECAAAFVGVAPGQMAREARRTAQ